MNSVVKGIIENIDKGTMFDSHFIIDTVILKHSDEYLRYAAGHTAKDKVTEYMHGCLAKEIASFKGTLVEQIDGDSLSYNIRGNASKCALWFRK